MFKSKEKIDSRTGKKNVGRFEYLKQLTEEFKTTKDTEAKQQVIANLANFAYDPINYEHLRSLGVIDLFLEQLSEDDEILVRFALGGLCNLCLDGENKEHINSSGGISHVSRCLQSDCVQTVIYAITTLMFLITARHKTEITSDANIGVMLDLAQHRDKRVQNLAVIFLEDYCGGDQVHRVRNSVENIHLPKSSTSQPEQTMTFLTTTESNSS